MGDIVSLEARKLRNVVLPRPRSSTEYYAMGCDLEQVEPEEARRAYARALELDPDYAEAHLNLGRLLHHEGQLRAAESHYRWALSLRGDDAVAAFNLGVVLEDQGKTDEAIATYQAAIALDAHFAEPHFNLSRLYEDKDEQVAAFRHLKTYRKLLVGR